MPSRGIPLCAISVDLDEIPQYFAIHGLPRADPDVSHAVYRLALFRLEKFASSLNVPLTFFAVGSDLRDPANAKALRALVSAGHEVANHSLDHRYDLTRLDVKELRRQVVESMAIINEQVGVWPRGFRAPGYSISDALVEVLSEAGVAYDSSVFPCPTYYAAKAMAMAAIAIRGRTSRSILDHPRVLTSPTRPYRLGHPYTRKGHGIVELPVQVTRGARLPYIGTSLVLAGPLGARWLSRMVIGEPFINLELHGIDVLDATDGLVALKAHQPDVKIPLHRKLEILEAVVKQLRAAGYGFVQLGEAAERFMG